MATSSTHPVPTGAHGALAAVGSFLRHVGEMLLAMLAGMAVFGAIFSGILVAAGTTDADALETVPALVAVVLMFNMTAPMVLWMRHRGHSAAAIAEMAGAMLAVALTAVVLLWATAIDGADVCGVECALMVPAMIAVMLLRRDEYRGSAHDARRAEAAR